MFRLDYINLPTRLAKDSAFLGSFANQATITIASIQLILDKIASMEKFYLSLRSTNQSYLQRFQNLISDYETGNSMELEFGMAISCGIFSPALDQFLESELNERVIISLLETKLTVFRVSRIGKLQSIILIKKYLILS